MSRPWGLQMGLQFASLDLTPSLLNSQEADYARKPEVKIPIPDVLKVQLVDDWENVTKNHQVHPRFIPSATLLLRPSLAQQRRILTLTLSIRSPCRSAQLVSLPRDPTVFSLLASYKSYAVTQLPTPAYSKRGEQPFVLPSFLFQRTLYPSSLYPPPIPIFPVIFSSSP
jgi:hypothetical protein